MSGSSCFSTAGEARVVALLRELASRSGGARDRQHARFRYIHANVASPKAGGASSAASRRRESNKVIACECSLFLGENTIETHLRRIDEKLGTHKRTGCGARSRGRGGEPVGGRGPGNPLFSHKLR